jgi:hypothetical protein
VRRDELELLQEIYEEIGPRAPTRYKGAVPAKKFAAMSRKKVDEWDFRERYLAHRLAKIIAKHTAAQQTREGSA